MCGYELHDDEPDHPSKQNTEDFQQDIRRLREDGQVVLKLKRDLQQAREGVQMLTKLNRDLQQALCGKPFNMVRK